jgi:DUF4097 and DUF4098 domain-containing protein YvlB
VVNGEIINESIEKSLKESLKELEKLQPELDAIDSAELQRQIKKAATINTAQMQEQIKLAQERYRDSLARLSEIGWTIGSPSIEKKSETFKVKGTPKVTVEAKNCDVSVRGWDKSEVSYSLVKISRNAQKSTENKTTLNVQNTDSTVDIKVSAETKLPDGMILEDGTEMRLEVFVPKKSNLKIVTGGEIRLEGVSGDIDLQGADEPINVRDADGKLSIGNEDGRIRVIGFRGAFDGRTGDGTMNLEGDFKSFDALAGDGTIVLTLPENANANLETNTEIENDGVVLTRADAKAKIWRVGSGGKTYRMNVGEGKVIVRSAGSMTIY